MFKVYSDLFKRFLSFPCMQKRIPVHLAPKVERNVLLENNSGYEHILDSFIVYCRYLHGERRLRLLEKQPM